MTRTAHRLGALVVRGWKGWRTFLRKNVLVREILVGAAIIAVVFYLVFEQQGDLDARSRARDASAAQERAYQAELRNYDTARNAREACLTSVNRSDGNRAMWLWIGVQFQAGNPGAQQFAARLLEQLDQNLPVRSEADCPAVPPLPISPEEQE